MKRKFTFSINKTLRALLIGALSMFAAMQSNAQISVTATGLGPGPTPYTTLGAAFAAINAGTHTGAVTVTVLSSTTETSPAVLNNGTVGPASYTSVLVKPAVGVTASITGSFSLNGTIHLLGTSNVTIDGSNSLGGNTRDLTILNNSPAATANAAIWMSSTATLLPVSSNLIKNCNIQANGTTVGDGIIASGSTSIISRAEAPASSNSVINNAFTNAQTGLFILGAEPTLTVGAVVDNNWTVDSNSFSTLGFNGVTVFSAANTTIKGNTFNSIQINGTTQVNAIEFSWTINGATVTENKISTISNLFAAASPAAEGIYIDVVSAASNIEIHNNFIADVTSVGQVPIPNNGHGIYLDAGGGVNIYHNSIQLGANPATGIGTSAGICFNPVILTSPIPANGVNLEDNIIVNNQSLGARYCVYSGATPAIFQSIDYNDYVSAPGAFFGNIIGTDCATLADMIANFGGNTNSINVAPIFISATDLHLAINPTNFPIAAGTPIPAVPTDIDFTNRDLVKPTIGAHELTNKITYTNLPNTCSEGDIILTVNVLSPTGVSLSGATIPRIYFQKNTGPWNSVAGSNTGGTTLQSTWSFTIPAAAMGGVIGGDIVNYYVVAQTSVTPTTVFSSPSTGLVATSVTSVTTPPTTPNSYTVNSVKLLGLTTNQAVCYNAFTGQSVSYPYTSSYGTPDQYTLTWAPAGPSPVPVPSALSSPITASIPPGVGPGTFTGTITYKNSVSGCSNTATVNVVVNPLPTPIGGTNVVCTGAAITLTSSPAGGLWTSSNTTVGTVGPTTGIVTGMGIGTTVVSYTLPTTCGAAVTVNVITPPGPITGIPVLCVSTQTTLSDPISGGTWSSSNATIGSVDITSGVVTGNSVGTAVISYKITGCAVQTKTVTVNPQPAPITGSFYVCEGQTTTLHTASATSPSAGSWSSGAPAVGTIGSTSGIVTGISTGGVSVPTATVPISYTIASTGCVITNTVTVTKAPEHMNDTSVCLGQTIALTNPVTVGGFMWTSSAPGFVSVGSGTGIATGVTAGTSATLTYTLLSYGCATTMVVSVATPPAAPATGIVVCSGNSVALSNSVGGGTWSSATPSVATVDPITGVVTGITGGTATIHYTTSFCNPVTYIVTVNQTPEHITGVTNLCNGYTTVSTVLSDPTPGGTWSICCGAGSISATGMVTGLTLGSTNIVTYTMPNTCYVTAPIIVDTLPAPIVGPNHVCQFSNTFLTDPSSGGIWSSSNGTIASIVATTGEVTGVAAGAVNMTYTKISGCYVTKAFTVDNPLPASVNVVYSPNLDTLCAGTAVTFTITPTNGGTTPTYQWQLFGVNIAPTTNATVFTYTPVHGDVLTLLMTREAGFCSAPIPAHTEVPINVYPNIEPIIRITSSLATNVGSHAQDSAFVTFIGQSVTFFTDVTNAGENATFQWYVDNAAVPGATSSSFARLVYDNDTVFCVINGNPKCPTGTNVVPSNKIILYADYLGTSSLSLSKASFSIFPNPNTGTFTLTGTVEGNVNNVVDVDVTNVLGQVIYTGTAKVINGKINKEIQLGTELPAGSYMLRVNSGTQTEVFHFVKGE